MGSSGTGSFTDYPGSKPLNPNDATGGASGIDVCARAFSTNLEEVSRSSFFIDSGNVPVVGTEIELYFNKRIIARTNEGIDVGFLPTKFNYLKPCMDSGYTYRGNVSSSLQKPIPVVYIDIAPNI